MNLYTNNIYNRKPSVLSTSGNTKITVKRYRILKTSNGIERILLDPNNN